MLYQCKGEVPELAGTRIKLRPLKEEDAQAMYECWSDESVRRFSDLPDMPDAAAAAEMINLLNSLSLTEDGLRWGIIAPSGVLIGSCGFNWWQIEGAYRGEVGCELSRDYWGQGYMREALGLIIRYGFHVMYLNRIEALTDPRNERAGKMFRSLGFKVEGCLRQHRHTASGFVDALVHSLLRDEWELT